MKGQTNQHDTYIYIHTSQGTSVEEKAKATGVQAKLLFFKLEEQNEKTDFNIEKK